ncbi:MAG: copper-binding protein [Cyclobacteriaceae bacterium]
MRISLVISCLLFTLFGCVSCSKTKQEEVAQPVATPTETSADIQIYQAAGVITSIPSNKKLIIIDHGEIPGFMQAMTMPFKVPDSAMIQKLKPQDSVLIVLTYDGSEIVLQEINLVE